MCDIPILGKILDIIVEKVFQSGERHVGFLLHYKRNLKNLEDEVSKLQEKKSDVEGKVNDAKCQGDAIEDMALDWLENANTIEQEVVAFRNDKTAKENMLCFSLPCPNYISRYRLSKEAEKMVVGVKQLSEKRNEIHTIRTIPLAVVTRSSGNYVDFHSRDKVFKDIVEALKDSEVTSIGVYGTGGVGKTTTVTKVGELMKKDGIFDELVMAVVSQDANVRKVQGQLAACLNLTFHGETDEVGRAAQLWNRLDNKKKNLIILDDVWQELDFKEIGIPITDGNKSCKVVLTSRNREVWKDMDVHTNFQVGILSEEESWSLFKKVGNYVDAHELRQIAWEVCKECQGLPVAINAIGAALKGKDMYAWEDALDKLKNSMLEDIEGINPKVCASLKWSYERLGSEDAKSCFLLCSLFPEDARIPIDDLVRYYMAGRSFHRDRKPDSLEGALNRVRTVANTLISCCLLLDENDSKDVVKMHDVVRDVAISIAKGDGKSFLVKHGVKHWPEEATYENCSVISLRPDDMRKFPDNLVCPKLHTLRLDCTVNKVHELQLPDRFFSGMENLTVLDLNRVIMSPILPASLAKLAKLQMLCLDGCKLGDIAIVKDLRDHLEILILRNSDIEVLPPEVGELTLLRLLDMENCEKLKVIPKGVISKLIHLEELYMPWNFDQWDGTKAETEGDISSVSLDELMSLPQLTTLLHVHIRDPALLPEDFTCENLVRFDIAVGKTARKNIYEGKYSTAVLQLENMNLANPLGGLLGKPKSKSFNHLTDLFVKDCKLKYLFSPTCAGGLVQLKRLQIEGCMDMEGVIGNEGNEYEDIMIIFSRLKDLQLISLPNLISLYPKKEKTTTSSASSSAHAQMVLFPDKVTCSALETLVLHSVPKITDIWYKQNFLIPEEKPESSFNQLQSMVIARCDKLMNVLGDCPKMETIIMERQKGKEVDGYVTHFPKLTYLGLNDLVSLESFCSRSVRSEVQPLFDHQVAFPALEELAIESLPNITDVWDKKLRPAESFRQLTTLNVRSCGKLVNLVQSNMLPQLRNLTRLWLSWCPLMVGGIVNLEIREEEAANNTIEPFPKLRSLDLVGLQNIIKSEEQPVFHAQVVFPKLNNLSLAEVGGIALRQLMHTIGETSIKDLSFEECPEVSTVVLPHLFRKLRNVEKLCMSSCIGVTEVFNFDGLEVGEDQGQCIGPLAQVRRIELEALPQLTCLWNKDPDGLLDLQNLETLIIYNCPLLRNLLTASTAKALDGLKELRLESCSTMEEVIASGEGHGEVIVFPKLEKLELEDLSNFKSFCSGNYNFNLPALQRVVLNGCPNMQTFTSGSVRMPPTLLVTERYSSDGPKIEDLNKHFRLQHLKVEEITATDERDGIEEVEH